MGSDRSTEIKPRMVIKTDDGIYLYVYKSSTGECWFEYTPARNQNKMK